MVAAPEITDLVAREWDLDPDTLHLNHGSFGAVPKSVREEQRRWQAVIDSGPSAFFRRTNDQEVDKTRLVAAEFLNADPGGLALVRNVTEGIGAALGAIPLQSGDEILITDHTYGAVRMAAAERCRQTAARLVEVALPQDGSEDGVVEQITSAIGPRTKALVIDHVAAPHGLVLPVDRIVALAHERGIVVVVDAAHAPGMVPVNVDATAADFWTGNFHKWMCAPHGAGALWVSPQWREKIHPAVVSFRFEKAFPTSFARFGTDDPTPWLCLPAAIDLHRKLSGSADHAGYLDSLAGQARDVLAKTLGLEPIAGPHRWMTGVWLEQTFADDLQTAEYQRGIATDLHAEVSVNLVGGRTALRVSAFLYNKLSDYRELAERLLDYKLGQLTQ